MKPPALLTVSLVVLLGIAWPQDKTRIFLTGTNETLGTNSNVSAAEIGSSLDKHCPDVVLTIERDKAEYLLQARHAEAVTKPYQLTLFDKTGDRVFSTETVRKDSAVKDVCAYIQKHK